MWSISGPRVIYFLTQGATHSKPELWGVVGLRGGPQGKESHNSETYVLGLSRKHTPNVRLILTKRLWNKAHM